MDFRFELEKKYYVVKIDPEVIGIAILSIISDETNSHIAAAFANATSYTKRGKFKYFNIQNIVDVANDPQGTMSEFLNDEHVNMTSDTILLIRALAIIFARAAARPNAQIFDFISLKFSDFTASERLQLASKAKIDLSHYITSSRFTPRASSANTNTFD